MATKNGEVGMQSVFRGALVGLMAGLLCGTAAAQSWQPTKTVEFIVPAGTGGGADQMARLIDAIIKKHKLKIGLVKEVFHI